MSIRKETSVVAFKGPVEERLGQADVYTPLVGIVGAVLFNRPEAVVIEESMNHTALGGDDGLTAVHTHHTLGSKTKLPAAQSNTVFYVNNTISATYDSTFMEIG